jgi:hypothetical protein
VNEGNYIDLAILLGRIEAHLELLPPEEAVRRIKKLIEEYNKQAR